MFKCHVCGGESAGREFVSEVFNIGERRALVEHIPAIVCARCGEATFSRETTERIRKLVHGRKRPSKTVPLDVFDLPARRSA
ncbi:MAG: YgiT-type zinc finger protein [Nitrospinae bacterium]|nr:YgiT-type zinc finger protein [Nitrospinota bacterium]